MRSTRCTLLAACSALLLLSCGGDEAPAPPPPAPAPAAPAPPAQPAAPPAADLPLTGNGVISGVVTGPVPQDPKDIRMTSDNYCQQFHAEPVYFQSYDINADGKVRWAFVYVKSGLEGRTYPTPEGALKLDQHGCMYAPHVFGLRIDQTLEIHNSDRTLHNVHAVPEEKSNKAFNLAHPAGTNIVHKKSFADREVMLRIKCDVHPWMSAYAGVLEHPFFAVTDAEGRYEIAGLPAGEYTVGVWHERLGPQERTLTITDAAPATADFTLTE